MLPLCIPNIAMETARLHSDSLVVSLLSLHGALKLSIRNEPILVKIVLLHEGGSKVNKSSNN